MGGSSGQLSHSRGARDSTLFPLQQGEGEEAGGRRCRAAVLRRGLKAAASDVTCSAFCRFFEYVSNPSVFFFDPLRIGFECCCCTA